jgi:hypothetical protein
MLLIFLCLNELAYLKLTLLLAKNRLYGLAYSAKTSAKGINFFIG